MFHPQKKPSEQCLDEYSESPAAFWNGVDAHAQRDGLEFVEILFDRMVKTSAEVFLTEAYAAGWEAIGWGWINDGDRLFTFKKRRKSEW